MSDASGSSAIVEFVYGEMTISHDSNHEVMTNEPTFVRQLAMGAYWAAVNPRDLMPGTVRAADLFVRARPYINAVDQTADARGAAAVLSVMRQTSVPWGISTADQSNLSTTRWRVDADQRDLRYCVDPVTSPSIFRIDLANLDFSEGAGVGKPALGVDMARIFSGEVLAESLASAPFVFQPADQTRHKVRPQRRRSRPENLWPAVPVASRSRVQAGESCSFGPCGTIEGVVESPKRGAAKTRLREMEWAVKPRNSLPIAAVIRAVPGRVGGSATFSRYRRDPSGPRCRA